ncbi:MAG: RNA methyltransferase [Salaquimonas sp.]|jgi:tRNA/rRNA methyltransferase|nr:RNA methyltransferase [Salaquimonas sp.]
MSGTDSTKNMIAEGPAIILVEPQLGENIGMVARAMANFGLKELRLVHPRDGWPSERARAASSGADHVIDAVTVFDTLEAAMADLRFVYATTARQRDMLKPVEGPGEAVLKLRSMYRQGTPCGVLFGRERWGLENEEVALADAIITFPVNPGFASLNIAQAVLLMSYEWMKTRHEGDGGDEAAFRAPEAATATKQDLVSLLTHLETALDEAGYFYPAEKREKMLLNLRNIFTHAGLKEQEIRTLRGVIASLERRWQRGRDPA